MVRKASKTVITDVVVKKSVENLEKEKEVEVTGTVSLGTTSAHATGRNKCGMAWKKESKRSQFSKGPPIAYLKSM